MDRSSKRPGTEADEKRERVSRPDLTYRLKTKQGAGAKRVSCLYDPAGYYKRGVWLYVGEFRECLRDGVLPPGSIWRIDGIPEIGLDPMDVEVVGDHTVDVWVDLESDADLGSQEIAPAVDPFPDRPVPDRGFKYGEMLTL